MGRGGGGSGKGAGGGGRGGKGGMKGGAGGGAAGAAASKDVLEVRELNDGKMRLEVTPSIAAAEEAAMNNANLQNLSAYGDLPPVLNANRTLLPNGLVMVGEKGAPSIAGKEMTNAAGLAHFESMGVPKWGTVYKNLEASGDAGKLAALFPAGSKYLGAGVEGVGIALPGGRVAIRIQHGGGKPLLQADVGKAGVYSDWMKKYGKTWVEQKESIAMQGAFIKNRAISAHLKRQMEKSFDAQGKGVHGVDDHFGNWGIDYKGRARVFDAGAYRPAGDNKVAGIWDKPDF